MGLGMSNEEEIDKSTISLSPWVIARIGADENLYQELINSMEKDHAAKKGISLQNFEEINMDCVGEVEAYVNPSCHEDAKKGERKRCVPEGRSAFLISEEAIQKLTSTNKHVKKVPTNWKLFEKQEDEWRNREKCLEKVHAQKTGTDEESMKHLEKSLLACSGTCRNTTDMGLPLFECYQAHYRTPLKCRQLILEYTKCVDKYRQKLKESRKNQSQ